jgi:hypothetical protein
MTAPPDRVWIVVMDGFGGGMWYDSLRIVPVAAHLEAHEYIPLDGTTMQAAIAAAEARGREQGLREARGIAHSLAVQSHELGFDDMKCGALEVVEYLDDLIPAPPADGGE